MKLLIAADECGALEEVELKTLSSLDRSFETEHHVFRFSANSLAEKEIADIAAEQERVYSHLAGLFGFAIPSKIEYLLTASPEENGDALSELTGTAQGPMNGFCIGPNYIFSAYNSEVKCLGHHEVTHLFSYRLCMPKSRFLSEGLAMYTDGSFWGKPNAAWVREFLENGSYISVIKLASDDMFFAFPSEKTYPISGAFTGFLVEKLGFDAFLHSVYTSDAPLFENLSRIFNCGEEEIEEQFKDHCKSAKQAAAAASDSDARQFFVRR